MFMERYSFKSSATYARTHKVPQKAWFWSLSIERRKNFFFYIFQNLLEVLNWEHKSLFCRLIKQLYFRLHRKKNIKKCGHAPVYFSNWSYGRSQQSKNIKIVSIPDYKTRITVCFHFKLSAFNFPMTQNLWNWVFLLRCSFKMFNSIFLQNQRTRNKLSLDSVLLLLLLETSALIQKHFCIAKKMGHVFYCFLWLGTTPGIVRSTWH